MPQIVLDYSSNLSTGDLRELLMEIHRALERGNVAISNCKSRAVKRDIYLIGDGNNKHEAYAHVEIALLPSHQRTDEWTSLVAQQINTSLQRFFITAANAHLEPQLTVTFKDINHYVKYSNGRTVTTVRPSNSKL